MPTSKGLNVETGYFSNGHNNMEAGREPVASEMSDSPLLTTVLKLDIADSGTRGGSGIPAKLTLELVDMDSECIGCHFHLDAEGLDFQDRRGINQCDLVNFVETLDRMYAALDGSTQLLDFDGDPILCLSVLDRGRGLIAVGGNFQPLVFFSAITSSARFVSPDICGYPSGVRVAFEGFTCDQTYIPVFLSPIARFVSSNLKTEA